jgi:hypothetical protein
MDTFLQRALDAIPEWTFDLIARMVPGGIVVATFAAHYKFETYGFAIGKEAGSLEVVVFLALAYAAGLAISTLAHLLYWATWPAVYGFLASCTDIIEELPKRLTEDGTHGSKQLQWNCPLGASVVLDRAHDLIKTENPRQGSVVTKLSAEVSLVYGLSVASGLYAALNCGQYWGVPILLLFAGYLRSVRVWQRHESILRAVRQAPKRQE